MTHANILMDESEDSYPPAPFAKRGRRKRTLM